MPRRQETFKIIPTTLVASGPPRPPMTSKQAKKAYKEATAIPKISKAERLRLEKAELDQQKKDWERERAAAKAKVVREKKAEKERKEKEERRKRGEPEKSRWVRPSQPAITGFVRRSASTEASVSRKRSAEEMGGDEMPGEDDTKVEAHSRKLVAVQQLQVPVCELDMNGNKLFDQCDDDEFGDFPELSQTSLSALAIDVSRIPNEEIRLPRNTPQVDEVRPFDAKAMDAVDDDAEIFSDMANTQLIMEAIEAEKRSSPRTVRVTVPQDAATLPPVAPQLEAEPRKKSVPAQNHSTRQRANKTECLPSPQAPNVKFTSKTAMQPPACRIMKPMTAVRGNPRLAIIKPVITSHPPPSTLAFLDLFYDDFYPSPSQEAREILSGINDFDMPSNTQIARELDDEISQPSLVNSCNKIAQVKVLPVGLGPSVHDEDFFFLSSQDFLISTQDFREMDTPSKPPPKSLKTRSNSKCTSRSPSWTRPDLPQRQPLGNLNKNITNMRPPPRPQIREIQEPTKHNLAAYPLEIQNMAPPAPKPRFFEEKEDDLLKAALDESLKMSIQNRSMPAAQSLPLIPNRDLPPDVSVHALQQTTRNSTAVQTKRTLKRVLSTHSDYGENLDDDDLADILALAEGGTMF